MSTSQLERAAYIAAHAILTADVEAPELVCPGARRSHTVDAIAGIIKDVFEMQSVAIDSHGSWPTDERMQLIM
jgi:hypothetical protein